MQGHAASWHRTAESLALAQNFTPCQPAEQELRSITSVPAPLQGPFHQVFSQSFTAFNAMQSQILDRIVLGQQSMALSAPTGSGKTVIFEMAGQCQRCALPPGLYLTSQSWNSVLAVFGQEASQGAQKAKAVYLAPSKFLVRSSAQMDFACSRLPINEGALTLRFHLLSSR